MQVKLTPLGRDEHRLHARRLVRLRARFEKPAGTIHAFIVDLSETGCRIDGVESLEEGDALLIELPGIEAKRCRVAWVGRYEAGCEFETPLYPAERDMLKKSSAKVHKPSEAGFGRRLRALATFGGGDES